MEAENKSISFFVPMAPVAKRRPRFYRRGKGVGTYKDPREQTDEGKFLAMALAHKPIRPLEGPIRLRLIFFRPLLKSFSKRKREMAQRCLIMPDTRPDLDNYVKFVKDALDGIFWQDDAQIVILEAQKRYESKTWPAGVFVEIREYDREIPDDY